MLYNSITLFAILASTAFAVPTSPPTYSTNSAPTYGTNNNYNANNPSITIETLHTEVFHWTAALNATRDSYALSTTDYDRSVHLDALKSQFNSLQQSVDSAQNYYQDFHDNDKEEDKEGYTKDIVRDCVQEIKFTGDGLIPILGHDVVAPLLFGVVKSLNGLLWVLGPLIGGILEIVGELLRGLLDLLF